MHKQVEEAGGIVEGLFALTDASNQLHGQPSSSGWFDGARNGLQRFEFTDAVVGTTDQWYMVHKRAALAHVAVDARGEPPWMELRIKRKAAAVKKGAKKGKGKQKGKGGTNSN